MPINKSFHLKEKIVYGITNSRKCNFPKQKKRKKNNRKPCIKSMTPYIAMVYIDIKQQNGLTDMGKQNVTIT